VIQRKEKENKWKKVVEECRKLRGREQKSGSVKLVRRKKKNEGKK
jgi:hypothetical protein